MGGVLMSVQPDFAKTAVERQIDAHDLRNYLDQFIRQNTCSRDVQMRWLASYAADLMAQAFNVKAGNHETIRAQVEEFRLGEIRKARDELAKQDQVLEAETKKLLRGKGD